MAVKQYYKGKSGKRLRAKIKATGVKTAHLRVKTRGRTRVRKV